jgi:hypothetical protein
VNASCSMFSQILKLIPGTDFKRIVTEKGATNICWPGCEPASSPATVPTALGVSDTTCWRRGSPAADIGSSG